jgi:hypothetical protein
VCWQRNAARVALGSDPINHLRRHEAPHMLLGNDLDGRLRARA